MLNRPYGGFPWIYLPAVLFDTFANSHNGYGGFEDLESATTDDATDFFHRYYAPANAVLAVAGDFDVDEAIGMIEKHFGGIKKRKAPRRPSFAEPPLTRRAARHASRPARADPGGRDRLPRARPGRRRWMHCWRTSCWPRCSATATPPGCSAAWSSAIIWSRTSPRTSASSATRSTSATRRPSPSPRTIRMPVPWTRSCARSTRNSLGIADDGLEPGELDRVRTRLVSVLLRDLDAVISRTLELAKFELIYGRAELIAELPGRLAAVTDADVRAAAAAMAPDRRAVARAGGRGCAMTNKHQQARRMSPPSPRRAPRGGCAAPKPCSTTDCASWPCASRALPIVEIRLRVPFLSAKPTHPARAALLAETVATGAGDLDRIRIAAAIQALGADLSVGVDADRLILSGNVLGTNLARLLDIVAAVLTEPAYDRDEVAHRTLAAGREAHDRPGPSRRGGQRGARAPDVGRSPVRARSARRPTLWRP